MRIDNSVALVTGANRGLGARFAAELVRRGATVYATARHPEQIQTPGVIALPLDITDPAGVAALAERAQDVTLLVNNAGTAAHNNVLTADEAELRSDLETHYFGTLNVVRAFAPILARAERSAVLNVLSVLSWFSGAETGGYSAAKSAEWSMTNNLRLALAPQRTLVTALHVAYMDTDMAAHVDGPKTDPAVVAALALDAIERDEPEVLADDVSRQVQAGLAGGVAALYPSLGLAPAS
jgi:NAD(P)-dependent dehydrogenase (short-subunit alcohol dehydrogenase family)